MLTFLLPGGVRNNQPLASGGRKEAQAGHLGTHLPLANNLRFRVIFSFLTLGIRCVVRLLQWHQSITFAPHDFCFPHTGRKFPIHIRMYGKRVRHHLSLMMSCKYKFFTLQGVLVPVNEILSPANQCCIYGIFVSPKQYGKLVSSAVWGELCSMTCKEEIGIQYLTKKEDCNYLVFLVNRNLSVIHFFPPSCIEARPGIWIRCWCSVVGWEGTSYVPFQKLRGM